MEKAPSHATQSPEDEPHVTLVAGLPARELERELARANRMADVGQRMLAFYLSDMQDRGLHQELGFPSAVAFATATLAIRRRTARELVAVARALRELPRLDAAFRDGRLTWSKLRCVARIATPENEAAWLEHAIDTPQTGLERQVRSARVGDRPGGAGDGDAGSGLPHARFPLHFELNALEHELWEQARRKLGDELGQPITDAETLLHLARMLLGTDADGSDTGRRPVDGSLYRVVVREAADGADAEVLTEDGPEPIDASQLDRIAGDADGPTPPRLRQRILARDGHACRSCEARRGLMVHHVRFRSRGGRTEPSNLITLCARCHGLVHDGLLRVTGDPQRGWSFHDRHGQPRDPRRLQAGLEVRLSGGAMAPPDNAPRAPLSIDDIPDVIDRHWWLAHQHRFEWSRTRKCFVLKRAVR